MGFAALRLPPARRLAHLHLVRRNPCGPTMRP